MTGLAPLIKDVINGDDVFVRSKLNIQKGKEEK